jgi:iron complex outermembrane recepter protein
VQDLRAENPESGAFVGDLEVLSVPTSYVEYAGFTDLTVRFSDQFDVQIGGRESDIRQTLENSGTLFGTPMGFPEMSATTHAFTYLLTPRYRISSDVMAYVRLSSGYRAGGINSDLNPLVPRQFDPDKTEDYEIGVKGDLWDHVLLLDASLYYIDWKDIQFNIVDPLNAQTYTTNAGHAKSQGLELSSEVRPWTGFRANASLTWNDAALTEALPADSTAYGAAGDRLPFTARFSGNLSADQHFPIARDINGFAGATVSYVGERPGNFAAAGSFAGSDRQSYPAYTRLDMRVGATYENWKANLYVTNVCNERGVLGGGVGNYPPFAFAYIQPRTVGLALSTTF